MRATHVVVGALLALSSSALGAQVRDTTRPGNLRIAPGRGRDVAPNRPKGDQAPARAVAENRVRQALAAAVRKNLALNDEQMRQLQLTDRKLEAERRSLTFEERVVRQTLRQAIEDSTATDQSKIEASMSRLIQIQRRRIDLLETEQKDLAAFMTPKQRAQYFALRERVMRRMMELEQGGPGGTGGRRGSGRRGVPPS